MSMLNVHPDIEDPFYRYKMPKLMAKIEGSGNGIKTAVVNMSAIAKALNRSPEYTTKFFGCELGAQVQMSLKDDRWIVNGAHDGPKLQNLLSNFIKKFVLCLNCENPETELIVEKNEILQSCRACGHVVTIPMVHRLATYIANHPPKTNGESGRVDKKGSKKDKKSKKQDVRENVEVKVGDSVFPIGGGDDDMYDDNDADWGVDVTEEAVRRRMEELNKGMDLLSTDDPDCLKSESERADILFRFVADNLSSLTNPDTQQKIFREAQRLKMTDKAPLILSELLFSEKIVEEIELYCPMLIKFCSDKPKAQKYLLGGIEKVVGLVRKDELLPKIPLIFMGLYDQNLVDESTFKDWSQKRSKKYVKDRELVDQIHKVAKPFMDWLNTAEEESGSSEEEEEKKQNDEKLDIIFSYRDEVVVAKEEQIAATASGIAEVEEDGFDIDAI